MVIHMAVESFELGGQRVEIIRSPQARLMRLAVDPRSGRVRLTLPRRASMRDGVKWAREQAAWVLSESAKLPKAVAIVPGIVMTVAGEAITLRWDAGASRIPKRDDGVLTVGGHIAELAPRTLRWLKREALKVLDAETREIGFLAGVIIGRVGIGDPVGRWGSCSAKGDIRYNWRLILAPPNVRRATVAHEVAHRVHMNHSTAFHTLVAALYGGDPRAECGWLKAHGTALHWFGRE